MTDISLISSFYRAEIHLPAFLERARKVAEELRDADVALEFVIVANDARQGERRLIDMFAADVPNVRLLYVDRESLYASWNRGVEASTGEVIGFWNADDARTSAGLLDGLARIHAGCDLVYFAYEIHHDGRVRLFARKASQPEQHRRRMEAGPFFLFRRELFDRVGRFDPRFRINGDWEWCVRALDVAKFCHSPVVAGQFYIHGDNLSNTGNDRETVELNVVRLLSGRFDELTPAPPDTMHEIWQLWASDRSIPSEVAEQLWGTGAQEAWDRWKTDAPLRRQRARRREQLRAVPKWIIDRLGLRPLLARLGMVKARSPE